MLIQSFLANRRVSFQEIPHEPAFLATRVAAATATPPREFAKPVVLDVDGSPVLAVVPATAYVDLRKVKRFLGAHHVHLASEERCRQLFPEFEAGAWPPFGSMKNIPTLADRNLLDVGQIVFEADNHHDAVRMASGDFRRVEHPLVGSFAKIKRGFREEEDPLERGTWF